MKRFLALILTAILVLSLAPLVCAEESIGKEYDVIRLGSYPQSEVKDAALISELNVLAPNWEDWTSYGYYAGNGSLGSMVQGDWMRYTDVSHNGYRYRGVKFTDYRPNRTITSHSNNYQYSNHYYVDTVYWFKFEPIEWIVLDNVSGLVLSKTVIDSQAYNNTCFMKGELASIYSDFSDAGYTNYANNYETSSIRKWLNKDFYNIAFSDFEKEKIDTTLLTNDAYYTSVGIDGYEELDSNMTNDNIFLLSYNEAKNSKYGFSTASSDYDPARATIGSDYAKCQGLKIYLPPDSDDHGKAYWYLRTAGVNSRGCYGVYYKGASNYSIEAIDTSFGIRPAMIINNLGESVCEHKNTNHCPYINPNCTEKGYTEGEYCNDCSCWIWGHDEIPERGHSYTIETIVAATHLQEGKTVYTCSSCNDTKYVFIEKLSNHTYSSTITPPTCSSYGFTVFTCECNDSYIDCYVDKLSHIDSNGDYKCDYDCGYEFEKPTPDTPDIPDEPTEPDTPDEPEQELNFFQKIIQWFKNLFAKLFGWLK